MNRVRVRVSILTALWLAVGIVVFSVLWAAVGGQRAATGGVAGVGLLMFIVSGATFAGEVNTAIEAVNLRTDDRVRHGTRQDAHIARQDRRIADLERRLADLFVFSFDDEDDPTDADDTPPHGLPAYDPEEHTR